MVSLKCTLSWSTMVPGGQGNVYSKKPTGFPNGLNSALQGQLQVGKTLQEGSLIPLHFMIPVKTKDHSWTLRRTFTSRLTSTETGDPKPNWYTS